MKNKKHIIFIKGPIYPDLIAESISKHSTKYSIGAHSIFLGQVRKDAIEGKEVKAIEYSAYTEMTEDIFKNIKSDACDKFNIICVHVYHSIGIVKAGEISLFVFVSSKHRHDCSEASTWIVNEIKAKLPIWGKEIFNDESFVWKENKM